MHLATALLVNGLLREDAPLILIGSGEDLLAGARAAGLPAEDPERQA